MVGLKYVCMSSIFCLLTVIVCTPHFNYDIEYPQVTKEHERSLHCWFNPYERQTLLELAESIETNLKLLNDHQSWPNAFVAVTR